MIDPIRHEQLEELQLVNLCSQILSNARNELYLNMHFLDVSLSSLGSRYFCFLRRNGRIHDLL